jgi:hypothetical protein
MGDDHASGLAVGREEQFQSAQEIGVGENPWRQEDVVVLGGVKGRPSARALSIAAAVWELIPDWVAQLASASS